MIIGIEIDYKKLRGIIAERGLKKQDVAKQLGITRAALSRILAGKAKPQALTYHKINKLFF